MVGTGVSSRQTEKLLGYFSTDGGYSAYHVVHKSHEESAETSTVGRRNWHIENGHYPRVSEELESRKICE